MIGVRGVATCLVLLISTLILVRALIKRYTRIRIGRIGYLSLRHIDYSNQHGLRIHVGLAGIRFHRPTITNPTWVSFLIKNAVVGLNMDELQSSRDRDDRTDKKKRKMAADDVLEISQSVRDFLNHGILRWVEIRLVDTTLDIASCGKIQLGLLEARLRERANHDERRIGKDFTVEQDISEMLHSETCERKRVLDFFLYCANLRLQIQGEAPSEILDHALINVWSEFGGPYVFKNVGISCKLGKLYLMCDDLLRFYRLCRTDPLKQAAAPVPKASHKASDDEVHRARMTSNGANPKDPSSLFDVLTEAQLHIGFCKASYQAANVTPAGKLLLLTVSSKDVVFDVNRLREESPDYRMLFENGTIAHQALISLISLSIRMQNDGQDNPILSVPMLTIASKTSSLGYLFRTDPVDCDQRNTNLTTINTVITSPASDIHSSQIPVLLALLRPYTVKSQHAKDEEGSEIEKFKLPKIKFGFSVHDPSIRVVLDGISRHTMPPMIIARLSSIFIDVQAEHKEDDYNTVASARVASGRIYYHSPENDEFDVVQNDSAEVKFSCSILPLRRGVVAVVIDGLRIHLSKPEIVECFARIKHSFSAPKVLPTKLVSPRKHKRNTPPFERIPEWLELISLQLQSGTVSISGADTEVAPELRGIKIQLDSLIGDYAKLHADTSDQSTHDMMKGFRKGHISQDFMHKMSRSVKSRASRRLLVILQGLRAFTVDSSTVTDTGNPILILPVAEVALTQDNAEAVKSQHLSFRLEDLVLGFSLYKVYAMLQALQVLRTSFGSKANKTTEETSLNEEFEEPSSQAHSGQTHQEVRDLTYEGKINLLRLKSHLPLGKIQMLDLDHLVINKRTSCEPQLTLRYVRAYIDSPAYPGNWDRILSIRDVHLSRETYLEKTAGKEIAKKSLVLRTDAIRLRIPHQFILYETIEAVLNSVKTATQIIHRYVSQTNDYVIAQHPKQAKHVPRIRIKSRMVAVEAEDDPFEARLGLIFRVGMSEQRMREVREVAFDRKVNKLREDIMKSNQLRRSSTSNTRSTNTHGNRLETSSVNSSVSRPDSLHINSLDSDLSSQHSSYLNEADLEFREEKEKLQHHNSRAWILRMQYAFLYRYQKMDEMRLHKWGKDDISNGAGMEEKVLEISHRPPLFSMHFVGVDVVVDKPSFPLEHLPDYVHRVGRGLPKDTRYSLLIPISLNWKMDEARVQIRDYPLPVLHIPPLHASQNTKSRAWEFSTDLVLGEEFPDAESIRHIDVCVVPQDTGRKGSPAFSVEVQRTVSSVKTYAEISIDLNSSLPTRVHWGPSMQPGIADVMRIMDTLTKPQQDPSPKLGFWDKIALVMHTSIKLSWKHDGDMHITLKGSRDPYIVMGSGAGLTKVFRGNVRWSINVDPDSRKLMEVTCDEYMLVIPDFSRRSLNMGPPRDRSSDHELDKKNTLHHYHISRKEISFQKILMKLTGDVRWTAGLAFERHCETGACSGCDGEASCRIWSFEPHWNVKLVTPAYSILPGGKLRDAFKGFRSHFIHGQISVTSRARKDSDNSYNTMHLTPKVFAHFFDWIHCFSGNLSLPIRSGSLFPSADGPKQKFGQHLMTLKYNLQLEPLYLSHVYKSTSTDQPTKVDVTGIKARIDSFTLDLHQRKEERIVTNKKLETKRKSQHMAIYRAQVDLKVTDLRALTAVFEEDHSEELHDETHTKDPLNPAEVPRGVFAAHIGEFDISEDDLSWIDMDDFTELDTILPEISPTCRIIPLAYSPRFIYDRDTTHQEGSTRDNDHNKVAIPGQRFGFERTHYCSMVSEDGRTPNESEWPRNGQIMKTDSADAQEELWHARAVFLKDELKLNEERMAEVHESLRKIPTSRALHEEHKILADHHNMLIEKSNFVKSLLSGANNFLGENSKDVSNSSYKILDTDGQTVAESLQHLKEEFASFNNGFVVHDIQMKWNNTLRNVLSRYIQQVNQRRGFSYYMSQKAVRFLSDLVEEQLQARKAQKSHESQSQEASADMENSDSRNGKLDDEVEKLIKQLLDDREHHFVVADENSTSNLEDGKDNQEREHNDYESMNELSKDYQAVNNYIIRLVAPQIQLQSDKNEASAVVLTAHSMQMKILAIEDKTIAADDVSSLVHRKFSLAMSGAQFFYAHQSGFHGAIANLLTQNSYGASGNSYWPPWVPIESVYDFEHSPRAFERIVDRTSAHCVYIKQNNLRIKQNDHVGSGQLNDNTMSDRTDCISVNFPKFNLRANSAQYYAMFTIALDLLMYSEPLQKERNEQIEKILLAADFSDLSGAPEMVSTLQRRIRNLNDFKTQFKLHSQRQDPQFKSDEVRVEKELEQCEDELFFLMKSIATAQQKREDRDSEVIPAMQWHLKADEILWHLMEGDQAFIDFGLSKASFQRTDNSDSSNFNTLEVEMMQGINLSPDPVFTQLFAPYFGKDRTVVDARRSKMVRIYWYMLEAIGGISVCDHFEVNLFPLHLQMEHDVGKKLFAYVFPDKQKKSDNASDSDTDEDNQQDSSSSSESDDDSGEDQSVRSDSHGKFRLSGALGRLRHSASLSRISHKSSSSRLREDNSSLQSQELEVPSNSHRLSRTSSASSLSRTTTNKSSTNRRSAIRPKGKAQNSSDDLTAMMNRASKNMSLVYIKVPSVVLALSYKGAKAKNFVDVTDFVFKMPTIEYRNKTWSYLDLAEHLKREVIKAVLAHTGSLLKDKMTHYRKSKDRHRTMQMQLTSYRALGITEDPEHDIPENDSIRHSSAEQSRSFASHDAASSAESLHANGGSSGHGLFNNAIGRHIQHLSHLARHKDGLGEDNAESTVKKTRMLLGKFIDKAK